MARDHDGFDPEAPEEREIGREMVDQSTGLGSVMAHLYRGEVERVITWRERLDSTTTWAVTIIAGILAYAFSGSGISQAIILVAMLIGIVFLLIEARRFQRYDIWRSRARSMQENLFANALDPSKGIEHRDWRKQLSQDYRDPTIKMPLRYALAHRLRRVYLPVLVGLFLVWLFRLNGAAEPLIQAAAVSGTPGWLVFGAVSVVYICLFGIAFWPTATDMAETDKAVDHGDLNEDR